MIHTVSSIRDWRTCKRLYRYRHIDLVRSALSGKALNVGRAVHRGLELFATDVAPANVFATIAAEHADIDAVELARVRAMLRGYYATWSHTFPNWQTESVEEEFSCDLGRGILSGKKDAIKRHVEAGRYLYEYKTTSDDITDVASDYWIRLAVDLQITVYQWQSTKAGEMPRLLYDVLRKPKGMPKFKKAVTRRKGESDESVAQRKEENKETLIEFEDRLVEEMTAEPGKWYVRREVHRTREQSEGIIDELLEDISSIENYSGLYPRNDTACRSKFGTCIYLGVCAGTEMLDSERFMKLETAHPELDAQGDMYDDCPL